jgi:hypothetical protein
MEKAGCNSTMATPAVFANALRKNEEDVGALFPLYPLSSSLPSTVHDVATHGDRSTIVISAGCRFLLSSPPEQTCAVEKDDGEGKVDDEQDMASLTVLKEIQSALLVLEAAVRAVECGRGPRMGS